MAAYKEVLDFLDKKYMDKKVKRKTPYSLEILELVTELGRMMRGE